VKRLHVRPAVDVRESNAHRGGVYQACAGELSAAIASSSVP
jgi:hypothetical protein